MSPVHEQIAILWELYRKQLLSFVTKKVRDKEIANDILQEVFIKIYTRIDTLKDQSRLKTWLFQITRNVIIDYYRTNKLTEDIPLDMLETEESEDSSVSSSMEDIEKCILPSIQNLPGNYQEALTLSEIDGLTQKEIANILGISYSGVKSRAQRGRAMLKESLIACCHFEFDKYGTIIEYTRRNNSCSKCENS